MNATQTILKPVDISEIIAIAEKTEPKMVKLISRIDQAIVRNTSIWLP